VYGVEVRLVLHEGWQGGAVEGDSEVCVGEGYQLELEGTSTCTSIGRCMS